MIILMIATLGLLSSCCKYIETCPNRSGSSDCEVENSQKERNAELTGLQYLGFANLGNTCFANAAQKLLWSVPGLTKEITRIEHPNDVQLTFSILMESLDNAKNGVLVRKPSLKVELNNFYDEFTLATHDRFQLRLAQQDSSEYLLELISQLRIESFLMGKKNEYGTKRKNLEQVHPFLVFNTRSPLEATFQKAIDQTHLHSNEQIVIVRGSFPENIILSLNRFDNNLNKISDRVKIDDFNNNIVLFPLFRQENEKYVAKKAKYFIRSVIIHQGNTIASGHYYTYNWERQKKLWILHDDRFVKIMKSPEDKVKIKDDIEKNGYVFLLGRIK